MTVRMTDPERLERARSTVASALEAVRDGEVAEASQLLAHAVHDGVSGAELLVEIVAQTGGKL